MSHYEYEEPQWPEPEPEPKPELEKEAHSAPIPEPQFQMLSQAFRDQLMACLEECAAGRSGLFSDFEHLGNDLARYQSWPEAARLRDLAFALQSILAQSSESGPVNDQLVDQFLDLCSIHGENDPGEPRLARAFLNELEGAR